jgi:pyroglutamyl-peptidase
VALNLNDARIADNAGFQPQDEPIDAAGPAAYFASLPVKAMVEAIRMEKIPASVSNTAGTFVCNHLMYGVLNFIQKRKLPMRGGFIHIPYLPEQVLEKPGTPSLTLEMAQRAVEAALRVVARARM